MVNFDSGLWSLLGQAPAEEFDVEDNGLGDNSRKYIDTLETNVLSKNLNSEDNFNDTKKKTANNNLYDQHQKDNSSIHQNTISQKKLQLTQLLLWNL